jgi:hypothetical protein
VFHNYTRGDLYNVSTERFLGLGLKIETSSFLGLFKRFYVEEYERYECCGEHSATFGQYSFIEWVYNDSTVEFNSRKECKEHIQERLKGSERIIWR